MRRSPRSLLLTVALALAVAPVAGAQAALLSSTPVGAPARDRIPERGEWSVGAWAGGAPTSYAGHFIGATPGRAIALTGVRLGKEVAMLGPVGVEYVGQLIPAAFAYDNPVAPATTACAGFINLNPAVPRRRPAPVAYCRRRVYGAGATPVGVQFAAPLGAHVRAFVAGNAGGLFFTDNMPVPQARRLNFAFDFGGGFELGTRRGAAVTLGYKLHHISNAWTAPANPGVDNHVFYVGFVHRLRAVHHPPPAHRAPAAGASIGSADSSAARGR